MPIRWAERWMAGYWLLTGMMLMFGPHWSTASVQQALAQFLAAATLFVYTAWCARSSKGWLFYWFPWLPALLWSYSHTEMVQKALGRPLYDNLMQSWEQSIWGRLPALRWSEIWPSVLFSEFLHLCYVVYYLILPVLVIRLLRRQQVEQARLALVGGVSTLLCCYFLNTLIPVQGPRPLFPPIASELQGFIYHACHKLVDGRAAAAAAFPSAHTGLAVATLLMGWLWDRKLFAFYLIFATGIISATIYGRFHYTVDAMAGFLVACVCAGLVMVSDKDV